MRLEKIDDVANFILHMAHDTIIFSNMNQLLLVEFVHENLKYEQYHMTHRG